MKKFNSIIWTICLLLISLNGNSQIKNIAFQRITTKDGLSQSTVNYIIQDKKGFMWFATFGGINKYDGFTFKVYRNIVGDKNSLSNNGVLYLFEDNEGYIWVVNDADKGLDKFDPEKEKFIRYLHNPDDSTTISSGVVYHVMQDKTGNIWICAGKVLNLLTNENNNSSNQVEFQKFNAPDNSTDLNFICENKDGQLLVLSNYLLLFNKKTKSLENTGVKLVDSRIISVVEELNGDLYIGSSLNGIIKLAYNKNSRSYRKTDAGKINITPNNRNTLISDSIGNLWITSESKGIFKYVPEKDEFINYLHDNNDLSTISDNTTYSLYIDNTGVLWIGTFSQGLCKYDLFQKQFLHYKSIAGNKNSLAGNVISSIYTTKPGELWVGADLDGGVNRFIFGDNKEPQVIHYFHDPKDKNSIGGNGILCLVQRKNGEIWEGSAGGSISKIIPEKPGSNEHPVIKTYIHDQWTFSIYEDSQGILWGGTWGNGLWKYDDKTNKFIYFHNDPENPFSLCDNIIWSINEDNAGNIWIGGHSQGLSILPAREKNKLDPQFINFRNDEENVKSLSSNTINVLYQDRMGTMWIGTKSGLNKVIKKDNNFKEINDKLEFHSYHLDNGLPDEGVVGILEDNSENLWLSTSKGLSKFNIVKGTFTNFDDGDGLQGNEFWHNSYFKDQSGRMYFGGQNGFNAFYPDSIIPNPFIPEVVFTDIKIFNKSVEIGEKINGDIIISKSISEISEINLSYKNNIFTLEFAALHYVEPEKNHYAYKLEGFEKKWNYIDNQRRATYTNLNPGKYTFKVKASNNDGIWNEKGTSIDIIILPPWWQTWWCRLLFIILIISTLFGLYYYRVTNIRNLNNKLRKLVAERTKEIEQKNKVLMEQSEAINETNTMLEERQQRIEEQTEELMAQKEELERINDKLFGLNATKDKFFTIIAHDLKNPFNAILGFCELLTIKYEKYDDVKKRSLISAVYESSNKIYKLLENLLQWSRSQTGNLEFNPEDFHLTELIDTNMELVKNMLKEKNLVISSSDMHDVKVYADKNMINTVIRNLITNSIKFTENGTIDIEFVQDSSFVTVKIKDTGTGINQDKLNTLFDIAGSKSTHGTRGESGTGLGLILCKEFIEKNNGTICVESEEGKGSTFSFTLPIKKNGV